MRSAQTEQNNIDWPSIIRFLESRLITGTAVANSTGLGITTINDLKNSKTLNPTKATAEKVMALYDRLRKESAA